ncbi:MAG: phosphatidate cytidylyltransferase [Acidaminococcaceae bacterium]|jgi:phosphatidate cytidylyltransferase|nr:phosphatidate cytidylyltransferase [Acidaminococcaceae bacterium]
MLTRILTALVGIPIAILVVTKGGLLFAAAILFLALVAWHEIAAMAGTKAIHVYPCSSGVAVFLLVLAGGLAKEFFFVPILALGCLAVLIEGLYRHCQRGETGWEKHTAASAITILYVGLLFAHLPLLRQWAGQDTTILGLQFARGEALLWLVLLGTWSSDTFAYFLGMAFGKHKFCSVSPKKSLEGAVAGFIGSLLVVAGLAIGALQFPVWQAVLLGLGVAIFAPIGDLVESILKRSFEIKDSGKLFPGHGGVLDRFDSLLFAVPVVFYLLKLFQAWN